MVITAIGPYAISATIDKQQALVLMECLNMITECPDIHELEFRMQQHGQHFIDSGVLGHALQAMDMLSKAVNIRPFQDDVDGDKAGDKVEAINPQKEDSKPFGKPN